MRSKKSAAYKAKQGPLKSVFTNDSETPVFGTPSVPKELLSLAPRFVTALRENLGENEVRALAANQVASPVLQVCPTLETAPAAVDPYLLFSCSWRLKPTTEAPTRGTLSWTAF